MSGSNYVELKVTELREECRKRNLDSTGLKVHLVERLKKHDKDEARMVEEQSKEAEDMDSKNIEVEVPTATKEPEIKEALLNEEKSDITNENKVISTEKKKDLFELAASEPDDWISKSDIILDYYNSDINICIDNTGLFAQPLHKDGFQYMFGGVKATHGINTGKVFYEIKISRRHYVDWMSEASQMNQLKVGWSTDESSLNLGDELMSFAYDSNGKKITEGKVAEYGEGFSEGDIIGCFIAFIGDTFAIHYTVNGKNQTNAFTIPSRNLKNGYLIPHIYTRNMSFEVNFGTQTDPWIQPKTKIEGSPDEIEDVTWSQIGKLNSNQRIKVSKPPESFGDCEALMMIGLPGSGKSFWAEKYAQENSTKKFNILSVNKIMDKMKISNRKTMSSKSRDTILQAATSCLNKLLEIIANRKRNYILDQTNVYPNAQRRRMKAFDKFLRKAIIVVPSDNEFERRLKQATENEDKDIPQKAMLQMKENFVIPEENTDYFNEIIFTELPRDEAEKLIKTYNNVAKELNKKSSESRDKENKSKKASEDEDFGSWNKGDDNDDDKSKRSKWGDDSSDNRSTSKSSRDNKSSRNRDSKRGRSREDTRRNDKGPKRERSRERVSSKKYVDDKKSFKDDRGSRRSGRSRSPIRSRDKHSSNRFDDKKESSYGSRDRYRGASGEGGRDRFGAGGGGNGDSRNRMSGRDSFNDRMADERRFGVPGLAEPRDRMDRGYGNESNYGSQMVPLGGGVSNRYDSEYTSVRKEWGNIEESVQNIMRRYDNRDYSNLDASGGNSGRDDYGMPESSYRGPPREMNFDSYSRPQPLIPTPTREIPRDSYRDVPREIHRELPRDSRRETPRDSYREPIHEQYQESIREPSRKSRFGNRDEDEQRPPITNNFPPPADEGRILPEKFRGGYSKRPEQPPVNAPRIPQTFNYMAPDSSTAPPIQRQNKRPMDEYGVDFTEGQKPSQYPDNSYPQLSGPPPKQQFGSNLNYQSGHLTGAPRGQGQTVPQKTWAQQSQSSRGGYGMPSKPIGSTQPDTSYSNRTQNYSTPSSTTNYEDPYNKTFNYSETQDFNYTTPRGGLTRNSNRFDEETDKKSSRTRFNDTPSSTTSKPIQSNDYSAYDDDSSANYVSSSTAAPTSGSYSSYDDFVAKLRKSNSSKAPGPSKMGENDYSSGNYSSNNYSAPNAALKIASSSTFSNPYSAFYSSTSSTTPKPTPSNYGNYYTQPQTTSQSSSLSASFPYSTNTSNPPPSTGLNANPRKVSPQNTAYSTPNSRGGSFSARGGYSSGVPPPPPSSNTSGASQSSGYDYYQQQNYSGGY